MIMRHFELFKATLIYNNLKFGSREELHFQTADEWTILGTFLKENKRYLSWKVHNHKKLWFMRGCKYFLLKVYEPESLDSMDHIIINPLNFLTGNVASISIFFLGLHLGFFFFAVMKILLPLINKYSLMCRTCNSFFLLLLLQYLSKSCVILWECISVE